MQNNIMFTCSALKGTNKVGKLKQLDNGYRRLILGALNMFNSAGQFYTYDEAKSIFEESGALQRRIGRGALRGEYGHPRQEGMKDAVFARRVMDILEQNVCCHHRKLELVFDEMHDERGNPVVAIYGETAPSGPFGHVLEKQLENPDENVCFSIRAFTRDYTTPLGIRNRALKSVVTFDYVNEPGMSIATKYMNPALEGLSFGEDQGQRREKMFTRSTMEQALQGAGAGIAQESMLMTAGDLFRSMGWSNATALEQLVEQRAPWAGW